MSNDYYKAGTLTEHTLARASQINAQLQSIEAAFDKLPEADALKQGRVLYAGTDTGAADVYVVSLPYPPASYEDGLQFRFRPANSNTGPSTINVNGLGVKPITRYDGSDLEAADIPAGGIVELSYDGEKFRLTTFHASALELARDWATKTGGEVLDGEYSAKAYASSEGLIPTGSAKEHAADAAASAVASAASASEAAASASEAADAADSLSVLFNGLVLLEAWDSIDVAPTVDLSTVNGNFVTVNGSGTISALGTVQAGPRFDLLFDGVVTFTHSATLICPGNVNLVAAPGDVVRVRSHGGGVWRVVDWPRRFASQAQAEAGTATGVMMDPLRTRQAIDARVTREWVNKTAERANDTIYTNSTGREIVVSVQATGSNTLLLARIYVDGVLVAQNACRHSEYIETGVVAPVPAGSEYKAVVTKGTEAGSATLAGWMEYL